MKIHFVCVGNVFRSRMAQAYLQSKNIPNIDVFSSGILAHDNKSGPISWNAARILKNTDLIGYMTPQWTRTTREVLEDADLVVFVKQEIYDWATTNLAPSIKKYEIWNIVDIDEKTHNISEDVRVITAAENIFEEIKMKIDDLLTRI